MGLWRLSIVRYKKRSRVSLWISSKEIAIDGLTGEQRAIVEKARPTAVEAVTPHAPTIDTESRFPEDSMDALRREGYLELSVSKEFVRR